MISVDAFELELRREIARLRREIASVERNLIYRDLAKLKRRPPLSNEFTAKNIVRRCEAAAKAKADQEG